MIKKFILTLQLLLGIIALFQCEPIVPQEEEKTTVNLVSEWYGTRWDSDEKNTVRGTVEYVKLYHDGSAVARGKTSKGTLLDTTGTYKINNDENPNFELIIKYFDPDFESEFLLVTIGNLDTDSGGGMYYVYFPDNPQPAEEGYWELYKK